MPTYYLGLDVHKVRTQYCLTDPGGEILAEGGLPTEEVATVVPADCAVVLEATGSRHHTCDALCGCAEVVKPAHPSRIKAIASARVKRINLTRPRAGLRWERGPRRLCATR